MGSPKGRRMALSPVHQGSQAVRVGTSNITLLTNNTERVRIAADGNVGIGTNNPSNAKLHVNGAIGSLDTVNDVMGLFSASYGNYLHIGAWNYQGSFSKNIVLNQFGGFVGIGISNTNPRAPLHAVGGGGTGTFTQTLGTGANSCAMFGTTDYGLSLMTDGNGATHLQGQRFGVANNTDVFPITLNPNGGSVGIGTNNPLGNLHVDQSWSNAAPSIRLRNSHGGNTESVVLFHNASNRSADGGGLTATLRNDAGDLRLQSAGGYDNAKGITVRSNFGYVGIGTSVPASQLHLHEPDMNTWNIIQMGPGMTTPYTGPASQILTSPSVITHQGGLDGGWVSGRTLFLSTGSLTHSTSFSTAYGANIIIRAEPVRSKGNSGSSGGTNVGGHIFLDSGPVVARNDGGNNITNLPGDIYFRTGNKYLVNSETAAQNQAIDWTTRMMINGNSGNVGIGLLPLSNVTLTLKENLCLMPRSFTVGGNVSTWYKVKIGSHTHNTASFSITRAVHDDGPGEGSMSLDVEFRSSNCGNQSEHLAWKYNQYSPVGRRFVARVSVWEGPDNGCSGSACYIYLLGGRTYSFVGYQCVIVDFSADGTSPGIINSLTTRDEPFASMEQGCSYDSRKNLVTTNGNVGIGTQNPQGQLHVIGTRIHHVGASWNASVGDWTDTSSPFISLSSAVYHAQTVLTSGFPELVLASSATNDFHGSAITFAARNPSDHNQFKKWVVNQGAWGARSDMLTFGYRGDNIIGSHEAISIPGNSAYYGDVLILDGTNKRVGISSARSPQAPLHIAQPLTANSWPVFGSYSGSMLAITDNMGEYGLNIGVEKSSGTSYIQSQRFWNGTWSHSLVLQPSGGNVGIGTNNPGARLQVNGGGNLLTLRHTDTSTNFIRIASGPDTSQRTLFLGMDDINGNGFVGTGSSFGAALWLTHNAPLWFVTNNAVRMAITGSGNVGIGKTNPNPNVRLDVCAAGDGIGGAWIAGMFGANSDSTAPRVVIGTLSNTATIGGHNNALNQWTDLSINPGGNVGIGITNPSAKLHVQGNRMHLCTGYTQIGGAYTPLPAFTGLESEDYWRAQMVVTGQYASLDLASEDNNDWHGSTITFCARNPADRTQFRKWIINQGNWGINSGKLSFAYNPNNLANPHYAIDYPGYWGGQETLVLNGDNRRVGINTAYPQEKLHVYGGTEQGFIAIQSANDKQCGIQFWKNNQVGSIYFAANSESMKFYMPNVGTAFEIYANGSAGLSGSLTQSSDITLKKNIEVLPYGLETISRLNPVTYHFRQQDDSDKKHLGLIAQEVQQILPELVSTGDDGKLSLSYIELVPVLINAVKEQQQTISEQSRTISEQQQTIQDLTSRLSRVESLLSQLIR